MAFMAFIDYEVVRVACQSRSWFVPGEVHKANQLHDQQGTANDFVNGNSHARQKPHSYPIKSTSVFRPGVGLER